MGRLSCYVVRRVDELQRSAVRKNSSGQQSSEFGVCCRRCCLSSGHSHGRLLKLDTERAERLGAGWLTREHTASTTERKSRWTKVFWCCHLNLDCSFFAISEKHLLVELGICVVRRKQKSLLLRSILVTQKVSISRHRRSARESSTGHRETSKSVVAHVL